MKTKVLLTAIAIWLALAAVPGFAQTPKSFADLDRYADKATQTVKVTLDKSMINLITKFIPANDPNTAHIKDILKGLNGIYVRVFEFDKEGMVPLSEVQSLRKQLVPLNLTPLVEVKNKQENTEVYMNQDGEKIMGVIILSAEPKQLTVVHIDGTIRPEDINKLSGFGGIPDFANLEHSIRNAHKPKIDIETKKDKEKDKDKDQDPDQEQ